MTTKTKPVNKPVTVTYFVSESATITHEVQPFNYATANTFGQSCIAFERSVIDLVFAKLNPPTWAGFIDSVKANNETLPKDKRAKLPVKRAYNALYQQFNNVAKITEAQDVGFDALAYWNEKAKTAKRATEPNLSYLLKGARAHLNGAKPEVSPFEVFSKALITCYKKANDLPNNKANQVIVQKLEAIASSAQIALPSDTSENDDTES
jgi:hypothetical protein